MNTSIKHFYFTIPALLSFIISGCKASELNPAESKDQIYTPTPTLLSTAEVKTPTLIATPKTYPIDNLPKGLYLAYWQDYEYELSVIAPSDSSLQASLLGDVLPALSDISPSGNLISYINFDSEIVILNLMNKHEDKLTESSSSFFNIMSVQWAGSDENMVVSSNDENYDESVYYLDLKANKISLLTPWRGTKKYPIWSPDNKWIAFISDHLKFEGVFPPKYSLYLLNTGCIDNPITCKDKMVSLANVSDTNIESLEWSPDGKQLAFISNIKGEYGIYTLTLSDSNLVRVYLGDQNKSIGNMRWSPDGAYIAFTQVTLSGDINITDNADIFVLDIKLGTVSNITNTASEYEVARFWVYLK